MESFQPPPSSRPPTDGRFGLRFSVPNNIPHHHQPLTPASFLLRAAIIAPKDKYVIVHPEKGVRYTYREWAARCLSLTFALLATRNWKKGTRVAVIAPNTPMILEAHHAILAAGGIDTPLNIRNNQQEINYILDHCGAEVILVDYEFKHLIPSDTKALVVVSNDSGGRNGIDADPYERFLQNGRDEWDRRQKEETQRYGERAKRGWEMINVIEDENSACSLCYTSGTTGKPKGVLDSHRGSYLAAISNAYESQLTEKSIYLWILPAFHAVGWTFPWAVCAAQAQHYILRRVDNDQIWNALLNDGVTNYCAAPTVNIALVNHPQAKKLDRPVRVAVAASAPTANLLAKMEALNMIPTHLYGLSESRGPFLKRYALEEWSKLSVDERANLISHQGHGFLAVDEARVVRKSKEGASNDNDERNLIDVESNGEEVGEIIMRGNLAMLEYYKDEEATKKTVKNGWLHTGDLAVRHPDGAVQIRDREKDIIISGGENISSLAVEDALASHKDVLECCVVAALHEKWGEVGHAFVVPQKGKHESINVEDLREHLRSRVSKFAVPQKFEVITELPKTSTGKVQKNVLRERVRKAASDQAGSSKSKL